MHRAVFLDRDGVINEVLSKRVKFVNQPDDFYLLEGVGKSIKKLNELNFKVFVVTNQGGIGLGYMKESALRKIHEKMVADLASFDASIDDIAYCPHKPQAGCRCRKPKPEMIYALAKKHNIKLPNSYMVGDRAPDIEAGNQAGATTVLIGNRKEKTTADLYFRALLEFVNWLSDKEA